MFNRLSPHMTVEAFNACRWWEFSSRCCVLVALILPELGAVFELTKVKGTADPQLQRSQKNTTRIFIQSSRRPPCQGTSRFMWARTVLSSYTTTSTRSSLVRTMSTEVGYPNAYQWRLHQSTSADPHRICSQIKSEPSKIFCMAS